MRIIMVIVLLILCFNIFPEGQSAFEVVYKETIKLGLNYFCNIYIIRCIVTKDLFLVLKKHGHLEESIAIIKLDPKYSEFIKGEK